jgi:hypothetical protein
MGEEEERLMEGDVAKIGENLGMKRKRERKR